MTSNIRILGLGILAVSAAAGGVSAFGAPPTRAAIVGVAPVGPSFVAAEGAVLSSGYRADGAMAITATVDPSVNGVEIIAAQARYIPVPRVSYNETKAIFNTSCVGCHGPGHAAAGLNLSTYASIKTNFAKIQTRAMVQRSMPPGAPLSAANIALLQQWVDANLQQAVPANAPAPGSSVTVTLGGKRDSSRPGTPVLTIDQMRLQSAQ